MSKKIGIIVGSLRKESYNRKIANVFANLLPQNYEAIFIEIGDLPLYNEDLDVEGRVPESWTRFRNAISEVDGIYFFTPEYNRSIPAALKNALDVASRPYGKNVWSGKPALVVSVSPGALSGFGANHHLRQSLTFLNMPVLQQPEAYIGNAPKLIQEDGSIIETSLDFFKLITDKYIEFFEKLA